MDPFMELSTELVLLTQQLAYSRHQGGKKSSSEPIHFFGSSLVWG